MTRADFYATGIEEAAAWADADIANSAATDSIADELRHEARSALADRHTPAGDKWAAWLLGRARGYRQAIR